MDSLDDGSAVAPRVRVLLNGHPIFLAGMSWLLANTDDLTLVAAVTAAKDEDELDELVARHHPGVAVIDMDLPGNVGLDIIRRLHERTPSLAILSLATADAGVLAAVRAGASGFVTRCADPAEIVAAIRSVSFGTAVFGSQVIPHILDRLTASSSCGPFPTMTRREHEILALVASGIDNITIARRLRINNKTVRNHISNILAKLRVPDRAQAIIRAREAGLGAHSP